MEHPTAQADHPSASFATTIGREEDVVAQQARIVGLDRRAASRSLATTCRPPTHCMRCCSIAAGPVLIAPHRSPTHPWPARRPGVEWHGRGCRFRAGRASLAADRGRRARSFHPTSTSVTDRLARELAAYLALHGVKTELATFRSVGPGSRRRHACSGAGVRRRSAHNGRLLPFTAAATDPRWRDPACSGERPTYRCLMNR